MDDKQVMTVVLFCAACFNMLSLFLGEVFVGYPFGTQCSRLGWSGFVLFFWVVCLLLTFYLVMAAFKCIKNQIYRDSGDQTGRETAPADLKRRRFMKTSVNSGIVAVSSLLVFRGASSGMENPRVKPVTIPVNRLNKALDNFRIVQLSDLHIDLTKDPDQIRFIVETVNGLNPDIIVITGDLVDAEVDAIGSAVELLAALKARHGCFFVTGDHEYYLGADGVQRWVNELDGIGWIVLLNDYRILTIGKRKLMIAGVPDYEAGMDLSGDGPDLLKVMEKAPSADYRILLAHRPKMIYQAVKAGFDLEISGHTHGGQIFPGHLWMGLTQPFIAGLHKLDNTMIYVSSGTGYWGPPLRLMAPSEITLLTLTAR